MLLETTELSCSTSALPAVFPTWRYLSQLCQKHYGCTPLAYRKSRRQRTATPAQNSASAQTFIGGEESKAVYYASCWNSGKRPANPSRPPQPKKNCYNKKML